jgi:hypothetical protein
MTKLVEIWRGERRYGMEYCHDYYPCLMKIGNKYIKRYEYIRYENEDGFWKSMFCPSPKKEIVFNQDSMVTLEEAYNFMLRYGTAEELGSIFGDDL